MNGKKTTIALVSESRDKLQRVKRYYEKEEGKFVDMDEVVRKILNFVPDEIKNFKN